MWRASKFDLRGCTDPLPFRLPSSVVYVLASVVVGVPPARDLLVLQMGCRWQGYAVYVAGIWGAYGGPVVYRWGAEGGPVYCPLGPHRAPIGLPCGYHRALVWLSSGPIRTAIRRAPTGPP